MPETVPFVALDRQHAALANDLRAAHERVVASSAFVLGAEVEAFEAEFAAACDAAHCVGVASGTAALTIALMAAGIGPGDEVVVPAHTFIASALGVLHAGALPVLCDVDAGTGLIDPDSAESVISERTAAILPVHLYGQPCDMDAIGALAARHGLAVVEDVAQAHGARWNRRPAGSLGTVAAFSFYPSKNLGALGDGGAVVTGDAELAERARQLRNIGQRAKGEHVVAGFNERLDGLQAAFLRAKLPHLERWNVQRRRHAAAYYERLQGSVVLLEQRAAAESVHHLFPIRVPDRDEAARLLGKDAIQTGIHYSPAVCDQPPLRGAQRAADLSNSRRWADEELSLPMAPELTNEEIERVCAAVASLVARV